MVLAHFPSELSRNQLGAPPITCRPESNREFDRRSETVEDSAWLGSARGAPACPRVRLRGDSFTRHSLRGFQVTFSGGLHRLPPPSAALSGEKTNTPAVRVSLKLCLHAAVVTHERKATSLPVRTTPRYRPRPSSPSACGCPTLRKHRTSAPNQHSEALLTLTQFTCLADDVMCTCLSARSRQVDGRAYLAARIMITWYDGDISLQL